jgi:hypothetical protein|tara:strand:- start:2087 stop:2455 length:369 start_codon:yes stop_codon:yes gene_type:complete
LRAFSLRGSPLAPPAPGLSSVRDRARVVSHRALIAARVVVVLASRATPSVVGRSPVVPSKAARKLGADLVANPASRVVVASRARASRRRVDARSHRRRVASRSHRLIAAPAPGPSSRERFIP